MSEVLVDTLNQQWKNDKSRFGYRMLQKMGWKEDKGLGKDESGSISHIKVKKREEGIGLGMEQIVDHAGNHGWNSTASNFNSVLLALKEVYRPENGNYNGNGNDGDVRVKDQKGKKKKEKKKLKSTNHSIISVGIKYKKFSIAKSLRNKSATDLQAVLGLSSSLSSSSATTTTTNSSSNNTNTVTMTNSTLYSIESNESKSKKSKRKEVEKEEEFEIETSQNQSKKKKSKKNKSKMTKTEEDEEHRTR